MLCILTLLSHLTIMCHTSIFIIINQFKHHFLEFATLFSKFLNASCLNTLLHIYNGRGSMFDIFQGRQTWFEGLKGAHI